MAIGTAIFLVAIIWFAIAYPGFRKLLITGAKIVALCAFIAGVCLIVASVASDHVTPTWVYWALVLVLIAPFLILHAIGKLVEYARGQTAAKTTAVQAPKPIEKRGTFAYCWNIWSAARNAPGVDLRALDRNLANTLAEAKREGFPPKLSEGM